MQITDLDYPYPEDLIAKEPQRDFRTLLVKDGQCIELQKSELLAQFQPGDVLLINDTRVAKRRVFSKDGSEILFVAPQSNTQWEVLFPARTFKLGDEITLPGDVTAKLVSKGLPQILETSHPLSGEYFSQYGELALPPYIQKARGQRHMRPEDEAWYQTAWARESGSCAAPTASLHFSLADLDSLIECGITIAPVTLHVGLGTFLPIKAQNLDEHSMHQEWCRISSSTIQSIQKAKDQGHRVWALGTTVTRAVESWAQGLLHKDREGHLTGSTALFIRPGFEFKVIDVLMTNFHQPRSTLLALVCAWAGRDVCLSAYAWAIERRFRLFSYGDLSVWMK